MNWARGRWLTPWAIVQQTVQKYAAGFYDGQLL